jgi:uncharacterized sulfatase
MLTRRSLLSLSTVALAQPRPRPNILWISCEDTGPQIGCYSDPHAITPTINRLAAQGVRYDRAYTVAGVCAPSRSGIITGMYPSTLGSGYMRCRAPLPAFVRCFPAYLRDAGYYCTNNVKTDYNFDVPKDAWDDLSNKAHWRNRPAGRPFFAVFNLTVTHESQIRLRGAAYDKITDRLRSSDRQDPARLRNLPPYYPDTPAARRDWANYYECITVMDYQAADRLRELEADGLLDDTIVFFWGDHGVGLPRAKRWLYEASTRVPLVIRIPEKFRAAGQGRPGSADDQLISFIDLAPTVLNLAGVPIPKHFQGRAFLGPNLTPPREYIYGARDRMDERPDIVRMVRDRRYRYLRNYEPHKPYMQHLAYMEEGWTMKELRRLQREGAVPPAARLCMSPSKPVEELYDVENDPHEIRNLAGDPRHRQTLERLRGEHETWSLQTRDLALIPEPIVDELGRQYGSRYDILRQPGSERYLRNLRALVDAVNRKENPALIRSALTNPDPAFRYWAVVGSNPTPELLKDPHPMVRVAAAQKLGDVPTLMRELQSPNDWIRHRAAVALDELGPAAASARPALQAALKDSNQYVVRVATHALSGS